jgi:hypothetical protein
VTCHCQFQCIACFTTALRAWYNFQSRFIGIG